MPVHLILTSTAADGLARALGKAHRRTSAFVNARLRVDRTSVPVALRALQGHMHISPFSFAPN